MIQLLGPIANIATTWLQGKQEKAKAKSHKPKAKSQAHKRGAGAGAAGAGTVRGAKRPSV